MNREDIIQELKKRGYDVVPNDVYKNGVKLEAIIIKDNSRITPTIYTEPLVKNADSIKQAADVAEKIYLENKSVDFDIDKLTDADFIMAHVRIGLEHENEHITALSRKTEYDGLMQYLYVTGEMNDTKWSVRISPQLAETAELDVDELWEAAEKNTFSDITITSMYQVLAEMGMLDADCSDAFISDSFMYIISNHSRQKGASAILNKEILKQFANEHNCKKLVILPSSVHECILIPCVDGEVDIESFDNMVQEVNSTQVAAEEVLLNHALVVNF